MSARQLTWYAAHARRQGPSWRRRMGNRLQESDPPTKSNRRYRYSAGSAGRRWRQDLWRGTGLHSMGKRQRIDGSGNTWPRRKSRGRIILPSWLRDACGDAQWRDAQAERQRGQQCKYIFCTGISWILWSFWRRGTSPTHCAPDATCWSPGIH